MAWNKRRFATRPRPLWRSLLDAIVFAAALILVTVILDWLGVLQLGSGGYEVVDGDSLRRGDVEIRLQGIDAPEYRQICQNAQQKDYACGKAAMRALQDLLSTGTVSCSSTNTDQYGRALATCEAGPININEEMVRKGWAVAYKDARFSYVSAEAEARRARRGLWQGPFERPSDYRARNRMVHGDAAGGMPED